MAEYRTIRINFWNDPFIEELDPKAKLLYIYLFTCPHANNLGIIEANGWRGRQRWSFQAP